LDEPTLGLDIMTSRTILEFILDARERGHSIIFSWQSPGASPMLPGNSPAGFLLPSPAVRYGCYSGIRWLIFWWW